MLVDTDVLIWNMRGNTRAAEVLDRHRGFLISAVSYMELVQGLRSKDELRVLRKAIRFWQSGIVHVNEAICARASFLVEEHALSDGLQLADALIAATALEEGCPLLTGNVKHYRKIGGIALQRFKP